MNLSLAGHHTFRVPVLMESGFDWQSDEEMDVPVIDDRRANL
jgi:hypothetical protein